MSTVQLVATGPKCHHWSNESGCSSLPGISRQRTVLPIKSTGSELIDRRRYFHPLQKDGPLPLNADISRPFDESCQVSFRLNVLSDSKIPGPLLNQRVDFLHGSFLRLLLLDCSGKLSNSFLDLNLLGNNLMAKKSQLETDRYNLTQNVAGDRCLSQLTTPTSGQPSVRPQNMIEGNSPL